MALTRPFLFYDTATSVCNDCLRRVEAKILIQDDQVFLEKWCPRHGKQRSLLASEASYYRMARERFVKPPERVARFNTPLRYGCPYDCGICPDHMQHGCLTLIEVTDHCNLACPICYADSGPHRPGFRSLAEIEAMLDACVANEVEPDVVQISGGEPTLHPDFFAILDMAKARPIKHLMVNTNGIRIAREPEFAARLASYAPGLEVYLQFDSLRSEVHKRLRGKDLVKVREQALAALNRHNLSTTLVVTLMKGLNDGEIGEIIDFALRQPSVRGVTFQPIQHAGRADGFDPATDRLTLTEVRRGILDQSSVFSEADMIPVPCNPDCLAMGYALKQEGKVTPLTGLVPPEVLLEGTRNTIVLEKEAKLRDVLVDLFATNHSPRSVAGSMGKLLCCLPGLKGKVLPRYDQIFRVLIMAFVDVHSFDLRTVKKSCVHIAQPDGSVIPFDTYNIFYRDDRRELLQAIREEHDAQWRSPSEVEV
jgi:uncharacterized radical SAM superfamily Fe-S cluster-containing enzyme